MNYIHLIKEQAINLCHESGIDYDNFLAILEKYENKIPVVNSKYHNSYYIEGETYVIEYGDYNIYYPWQLGIIYAMLKEE